MRDWADCDTTYTQEVNNQLQWIGHPVAVLGVDDPELGDDFESRAAA